MLVATYNFGSVYSYGVFCKLLIFGEYFSGKNKNSQNMRPRISYTIHTPLVSSRILKRQSMFQRKGNHALKRLLLKDRICSIFFSLKVAPMRIENYYKLH